MLHGYFVVVNFMVGCGRVEEELERAGKIYLQFIINRAKMTKLTK